jgi:hypothetical protein
MKTKQATLTRAQVIAQIVASLGSSYSVLRQVRTAQ